MNKDRLEKSNFEHLGLLAEVFNVDRIVTPAEVEQVLVGILKMINQNKKENQNLNAEVQASLTKALTQIINERNSIIARVENIKDGIESSVHSQIDSSNKKIEKLFAEIKLLMPENGKDADEEYIINEVLKRVKLPEYKEVMLDDGEQIADKLEALAGDKRLDASAIKNLPTGKGGSSAPKALKWLSDITNAHDATDGQVLVSNGDKTYTFEDASGGGVAGTINELAYFDTADSIASLAVATYPSLTQLSYVKGVTSAIQTQLNAKAAALIADENYVTDAQLVVIGNTSGTNTGDQAVPDNLTDFVGQTAWRVFYSDGSGDVTELALGADGTFLKSNGAAVAPSFATPAGSGDVSKVGTPVNNQVGVWTGDGTIEGDAALTYDATTDTLTSVTFAGNLTGNVTGNVTGSSGSTTGNAATVTNGVYTTGADSVYLTPGTAATTYQPLDSDLTTIAGLTATTDNFIVSVASAWASRTPAQVRTTLGLVIGTNVQAYDADLTTWAGVTPGTGVTTALAINIGSAGAFVTLNGALGTPSSGTVTNLTGTASININGTVGATTPTTATFTTATINTSLLPDANDGAVLGASGNGFSDLFLASGAVINSAAGTATLTFGSTIASNVDITIPDEAYGVGWNGSLEAPTKNAVYDKIETVGGGVTSVEVSISSANLLAIFDTPVQVIAGVAGKIPLIVNVLTFFDYGGTQYGDGSALRLVEETSGTTLVASIMTAAEVSGAVDAYKSTEPALTAVRTLGKGVFLTAPANFITGTGTMKLYITYSMVTPA